MRGKVLTFIFVVLFCMSNLVLPVSANNELNISAKSAVLLDKDTNSVIYSKNCDEKLPMASTTKIMTAIIAIENSQLDKIVKVDDRAIGVEGTSLYMKKGECFTMEELIKATLLQSANDAAAAIAYNISGSIESFAELMNNKARELGLTSTHFDNPHGLDSENHYTTAYELAIITSYALNNPTFSHIVSTKNDKIGENDSTRILVNHNKFLKMYDGCIGVKTGFTKRSGRCLVTAVSRNGQEYIAVTLSAPCDWNDHKALYDYAYKNYSRYQLSGKNGSVFQIPVAGTDDKYALASTDNNVFINLPVNKKITVVTEMPRFLFKPLNKGTQIGTVTYFSDNKEIYKSKISIIKETT